MVVSTAVDQELEALLSRYPDLDMEALMDILKQGIAQLEMASLKRFLVASTSSMNVSLVGSNAVDAAGATANGTAAANDAAAANGTAVGNDAAAGVTGNSGGSIYGVAANCNDTSKSKDDAASELNLRHHHPLQNYCHSSPHTQDIKTKAKSENSMDTGPDQGKSITRAETTPTTATTKKISATTKDMNKLPDDEKDEDELTMEANHTGFADDSIDDDEEGEEGEEEYTNPDVVGVPVVTLAQVARHLKLTRIDVLKIDCEGAEVEVLNGMTDSTWAMTNQIVLEVEGLQRLTVSSPISDLVQTFDFSNFFSFYVGHHPFVESSWV